jgi:hypothetical protein
VELWRHIAPRVPWLGTEGVGWQFSCGDLSPQQPEVEEAGGTCLILMGGLTSDDQQVTESTASYMDKVFTPGRGGAAELAVTTAAGNHPTFTHRRTTTIKKTKGICHPDARAPRPPRKALQVRLVY